MTTTADLRPPPLWRRAWAFALEIWRVLRRPTAVFSLGTVVLVAFILVILASMS